MKMIKAEEFNIFPEKDISCEIAKLISTVQKISGEKTVVFQKGRYFIDSEKCLKKMLYITNTVGDGEFKKGEIPHEAAVAFFFDGLSDLVFDGGDSVFVIDGKVTNVVIEKCENITLKNLEIRHAHPDMHELKVVSKTMFCVDFIIDKDTLYEFENSKLYFYAKDYRVDAQKDAKNARWIAHINDCKANVVERVLHPLHSALKIKDIGQRKIRVFYPNTKRFKPGDRFYIYDVRRQFVGIFVDQSKNVTLQNIKQRFNYSLSLVAQRTENITCEKLDFSSQDGSARKISSVVDFVQICMCKGKITIKDSNFCGAGDDCLNIHGIHFKIVKKEENEIIVRFMHPQSHGFNPLSVGDTIAFIDSETLLEKDRAKILKSELLNEYDIVLTLDKTDNATTQDVIENISACPELEFSNNTINKIITRGLLITTRGKVVVENNHFLSTSMSAILLSDDAKSWYESGMCQDVTIKNNKFDYCGQTPILIKPENKTYDGAVHKNISIISNKFDYKGVCIDAQSTQNLLIKDNNFLNKKFLKVKNCTNIKNENG